MDKIIQENFTKMTTVELCKKHYDMYGDMGDNPARFNSYICYISADYNYTEVLDDSDKLKIITYLLRQTDNIRLTMENIQEQNWDALVEDYVFEKTTELFYKNECNEWMDKIIGDYHYEKSMEEERNKMSFKIAIKKIIRSKIYNFGLGLKINMRDAGII